MSIDVERGAFGPLLRSFRLAARMSQEELAERARMSVEGISLLERGRRRAPYRETIRLLGDALRLCEAQRRELEAAAGRVRVPSVAETVDAREPTGAPAAGAAARHRLPIARTALIGRQAEIGTIIALLAHHRIVSLIGTGGIGKTRTALAVGEALAADSSATIRLVEFAPLARDSFVAAAVAQTLDIKESTDHPVFEALVAKLGSKPTILIFDNCEHVIDETAALADALLRECAGLRILATSREPLRIAGEQAHRLPSLAVPTRSDAARISAAKAIDYPAIALFVERARAVDRSFAFTDGDAPVVVEICRLLDGIALAIELAAARVNALPVRALFAKLDGRLHLLTSGDRTALPRHQTMRALIDWSYDLLSPLEAQLFERLSVFAGGCNLIEAAAVCGADAGDEFAVFVPLTSLVDKSLVAVDSSGRDVRYRLLESARIYAAEKLAARGETQSVAARHAAAYLDLAEQLERERNFAPDDEWLARAEPEVENWRAALTFTLGDEQRPGDAARLAGALRPVWVTLLPAEGRRWVDATRAAIDERTPLDVRAKLDFAATAISFALSEYETVLASSRRFISVFRDIGERGYGAHARYFLGGSLVSMGRLAEGLPELERAAEAARAIPLTRLTGLILQDIAYGNSLAGRAAEARAAFAETLEIWIAIGAQRNVVNVSVTMAEHLFHSGEVAAAIELAVKTIARLREGSYSRNLVIALNNLAAYYIACDRFAEARTQAREALAIAVETQTDVARAWSLQHLSAIGALSGGCGEPTRAQRAARVLGHVDVRLAQLGSPRTRPEQNEYDRARSALSAALGSAAVDGLIAEGAALTSDRADEFALTF